jgi:hypothetical protein
MLATGAEMMRIAACLATERGLHICCPVHDAFLLIAPLDRLEADARALHAAMAEASRIVLGGFELRSDVHYTRWPERFRDEGDPAVCATWDMVMALLDELENGSVGENIRAAG